MGGSGNLGWLDTDLHANMFWANAYRIDSDDAQENVKVSVTEGEVTGCNCILLQKLIWNFEQSYIAEHSWLSTHSLMQLLTSTKAR